MTTTLNTSSAVLLMSLTLAACGATGRTSVPTVPSLTSVSSSSSSPSQPSPPFPYPLPRGAERITKKPFGIHITPATSPVQPERYSGFHTGTDFETFSDEAVSDVAIMAVCDGPVRFAGHVNGYGGVLIEQCVYQNQPVTVLYGHLRQTSITLKVGDALATGQRIGVLGTGYSSETDGERKHLHLGVHGGTAIDFRGYVSSEKDLSGWINAYP